MTHVDREQVRRDAESWKHGLARGVLATDLADHCLTLLAELEQAERERDEAKETVRKMATAIKGGGAGMLGPEILAAVDGRLAEVMELRRGDIARIHEMDEWIEQAERDRDYWKELLAVYRAAAGRGYELEARLAAVPALVEAINEAIFLMTPPAAAPPTLRSHLRKALAAYEQATK